MRYRVNLNFDGYKLGDIVTGEADECEPYVRNGWLSLVDDAGERIFALPPMASPVSRAGITFNQPATFSGAATWTPGDEDDPVATD